MPQFIMTQYINIHLHLHAGSIEKAQIQKSPFKQDNDRSLIQNPKKTATDREMKEPHESQGSIFSST